MKYWETIADQIRKQGWSLGYASHSDITGGIVFTVDAHRDDGKRFIVKADELLTAFVELESVTK